MNGMKKHDPETVSALQSRIQVLEQRVTELEQVRRSYEALLAKAGDSKEHEPKHHSNHSGEKGQPGGSYPETQLLILQNREKERVKIAQDIHDGPLQQIMALSFGLTEALQINEKEQRLMMLSSLRADLQLMAQELRTFCSDLRPPALAPFGLEKAIRSHLQTFASKHPNVQFRLDLMADGQSLPEQTRLFMFRIYQELMNNAGKHSGASVINIRLTLDEAQTELEIQDNGCGFQLPSDWLDMARQGHFGLVGVLERAEAMGGKVLLRSHPHEGTLVRVIIPGEYQRVS